jgi:hypothetical protein
MTYRSFFYRFLIATVLFTVAHVTMPLLSYSSLLAAYPDIATTLRQTQSLTSNHSITSLFNNPMGQLKHVNFKQLEQKAGPLFGRFYQERILINNPIPVQSLTRLKPLSIDDSIALPLAMATLTSVPAYPAPQAEAKPLAAPVLDTRSVSENNKPRKINQNFGGALGWLKRFTQLDTPINELQLFIPTQATSSS